MTVQYKTVATQIGIDLINQHVLNHDEPFIASGWYIALGDGDLTPTSETTQLVHKIFDKDSPDYPGFIVEDNLDLGRLAKITIPSSLEGHVIKEIGLFNENDELMLVANTHIDLSVTASEGLLNTFTAAISLKAIPDDVLILYVPEGDWLTREEAYRDFQIRSEKGQANGYAPLDENARVPLMHLPAFRNIGETIFSLLPLEDAGLHLLDGALISNGSYGAFVNHMERLYAKTYYYAYEYSTYTIYTQTTTITADTILYNSDGTVYSGEDFEIVDNSGYEIQYNGNTCTYTSADNLQLANYFTSEANWQTSVTNNGVCGKFVVDTTNHTVRLPKITGFVEGTIDVTALGELCPEALPNIEGGNMGYSDGTVGGGPYEYVVHTDWEAGGSGAAQPHYAFNAHLANPVYQDGAKVQPQSIKGLMYVCIATYAKTDIEVNINEITTDLNGKADVDLTNVSNTSGFRRLVEVSPKSLLPSWYKVYDEYDPTTGEFIGKWCEQGGICYGFTPVTLLKPYLDTNYTLLLSILGGGGTYGYCYGGAIINNASFQAGSIATAANEHRWETKGYIS